MRFISFLFMNQCLTCQHFTPIYYENTLELSTCKKFKDRYADMCRMDEGKCGKEAKYFSPKKNNDTESDKDKKSSFKYGMTNEMYELREKQHMQEMIDIQ